MDEAQKLGAQTRVIEVDKKNIVPCKEYIVCEKKGFCPIDDDMKHEIYSLLRQADVIVAATPVFFYNMTAQLKALIDRCQTFWARKYNLKLKDPGSGLRRGFVLAVAATKGKNLFEGIHLTAKYFFDAAGASYHGSLTYTGVEKAGDMKKHPTFQKDVKDSVTDLLEPFLNRKKILFACRENACRSQMASALAQYLAGDKIEALTGGSHPAAKINSVMVEAMQELGIDMAFRAPQSIEAALATIKPDIIITMGCKAECPVVSGAKIMDWDLPDPSEQTIDFMRKVRDDIKKRVEELIREL
jgi:multimeric flavodoxin WrbA/protein-tyrosine-phosphatase